MGRGKLKAGGGEGEVEWEEESFRRGGRRYQRGEERTRWMVGEESAVKGKVER
jgi:hypothetical protein